MQSSARDAYLVTQVMTATPQKLHLMLIDGAIRQIQLGKQHWQAEREDAAGEALIRSQEIVGEMLAGVSSGAQEVSKKLAGIYLFLFRTLTEAHLRHDEKQLNDALRVLEVERETWHTICERFGAEQPQGATTIMPTAAPAPARKPISMPAMQNHTNPPQGISFQA